MTKRLIVVALVMFLLSGCALQFTRPESDQDALAAMLRLGTYEGMKRVFANSPSGEEAGGYICPVVTESILPALQGECADIDLKNQALYVLSAAAHEWFPDWEASIAPYVDALDTLFGVSVDCTPEQMIYLRAFFQGVADACQVQAKLTDSVLTIVQPEE